MQIFIDSSNAAEIEKWIEHGIVDGVTTNPSILLKDGHNDLRAAADRIATLIYPRPLSVEVIARDRESSLEQARVFAGWNDNIVVKVTVIDEDGRPNLSVIHTLEQEGIRVNCTACLSFGQAMLAAKAGASYVSLFVGRINDEGNDGPGVIRMTRKWLDTWGYKSQIIAGSIRSVSDIQQAALAGAHVVTIPPAFLDKLVDHQYSRLTVQQFLQDGETAFRVVEQLLA